MSRSVVFFFFGTRQRGNYDDIYITGYIETVGMLTPADTSNLQKTCEPANAYKILSVFYIF